MPELKDYIDLVTSAKDDVKSIYQAVEDEVNQDATLADLDTISKTSVEGLSLYVSAFLCWFFETIILKPFQTEIETKIADNINPNDRWWAAEVLTYQDGDDLLFDDTTKRPYYAVIDTTKQIIKFVAVKTTSGLCAIKVAKDSKVPLSNDELTRFKAWVSDVQPSGANIEVITLESDKIKTPVTVYYNALIALNIVQAAVEDSVNNYLNNLPYNGKFSLTKYKDAIDATTNVIDSTLGTFEARPDAEITFSAIDREYEPLAGHIQIDPAFPLSTIISYVPVID
jgi:hypothetical protein